MKTTEEFPTIFARAIGEQIGLLLKREHGVDHKKLSELEERMRYFQQMAVTSPFEECVISYYGMTLSKTQLDALQVIHKSTKPWVTGHVVGVLMNRIQNGNMQNKDFAESVRVLVEQAQDKTGQPTGKMQGIVVKSTQTDKKAVSQN